MSAAGTLGRAVAGLAVVALVGLGGCGGGDGGGPVITTDPASSRTAVGPGPGSGTPTPSGSPTADQELFEFAISGGQASPPLDRVTVALGRTVRIVVTSDQADEVHLHGYDLDAHTGPGEPGVIEFVADQAGLFELETHETGLVLLQLLVVE
jgi:hypothetical protein